MPQFLNEQKFLIYTTTNKFLFQSPIKLFEYLAAEKQIIAAKTDVTKKYLNLDYDILYEAGDLIDLEEAINKSQRLVKNIKRNDLFKLDWNYRLSYLKNIIN